MKNIKSNEITNENDFKNRRQIIKAAGLVGASALVYPTLTKAGWFGDLFKSDPVVPKAPLTELELASDVLTKADITAFEHWSTYQNFYEFSSSKTAVHELAAGWSPKTDTLTLKDDVTGKEIVIDRDMIIAKLGMPQERIYRFRCVEKWAAVVPWNGWALRDVLKAFGIDTLSGHYISMFSAYEKDFAFGPYQESMQTEIANVDTIFLASGAYGKDFEGGSGPNFRVIAPQCYGYKTAKSILMIKHSKTPIVPTWTKLSGREYPFNSVVMPNVSHPRWSQSYERPLGKGILNRVDTLPYNGYGAEFAHTYKALGLAVESRLV